METYTSEIKEWCDRKFYDVINVLGTCNVNIHVYSYYRGGEWVVCDFWHCDDKNKLADTTFAFGDDTNLDDLYSPNIGNVIILFELLTELTKRSNGKIHVGMPEQECVVKTEQQGRDLDREPMTRIDFKDFLPKIGEDNEE